MVLVGGEFTDGVFVNLHNTGWRFDFHINSLRLGPGAGASGGYVIVFLFNCISPHQIDGTSVEDWGLNISIAAKWGAIAKSIAKYKLYSVVARVGTNMALGMKDAEALRNVAHTARTAFDLGTAGTSPTLIALDTPAGVGLELSLVKIYGKFHLGSG